jgi:hypothetical protein
LALIGQFGDDIGNGEGVVTGGVHSAGVESVQVSNEDRKNTNRKHTLLFPGQPLIQPGTMVVTITLIRSQIARQMIEVHTIELTNSKECSTPIHGHLALLFALLT